MHQAICPNYRELIDPDLAHTSLAALTVARALNFITLVFKEPHRQVIVHCKEGDYLLAPSQFSGYSDLSAPAATLAVTFWGGPPGQRDWYSGSLLSFLVDRLFNKVARGEDKTVEDFLRSVAK